MNETKWPKFRLKMDTPDHRTGEIFWRTDNWMICDDEDLEEGRAFMLDNIDDFDEWFEEVKESSWWKPEIDDTYYCVLYSPSMFTCDTVGRQSWKEDEDDQYRYSMGNVFKTKEAADRFANYLKAVTTVRQDEGVLTPKEVESTERSSGNVWCIAYTFDSGLLAHTCPLDAMLPQTGAIYFNSLGHAKDSLSNHPDEWKIIANYDWSRE